MSEEVCKWCEQPMSEHDDGDLDMCICGHPKENHNSYLKCGVKDCNKCIRFKRVDDISEDPVGWKPPTCLVVMNAIVDKDHPLELCGEPAGTHRVSRKPEAVAYICDPHWAELQQRYGMVY